MVVVCASLVTHGRCRGELFALMDEANPGRCMLQIALKREQPACSPREAPLRGFAIDARVRAREKEKKKEKPRARKTWARCSSSHAVPPPPPARHELLPRGYPLLRLVFKQRGSTLLHYIRHA